MGFMGLVRSSEYFLITEKIEEEWLETLAIDYTSFHYIDFVQEAKELLPIFEKEKVDVSISLSCGFQMIQNWPLKSLNFT